MRHKCQTAFSKVTMATCQIFWICCDISTVKLDYYGEILLKQILASTRVNVCPTNGWMLQWK